MRTRSGRTVNGEDSCVATRSVVSHHAPGLEFGKQRRGTGHDADEAIERGDLHLVDLLFDEQAFGAYQLQQ